MQDRHEHQSLSSQSLIAAFKKETAEERITTLVTLLHNTIPFDGDAEQVKTLIRRALTASMRVCYDDKAFRAQLSEETLLDIARTTDGIAITLDRVDANTAETKEARATNALLRNCPEDAFKILSAAADSFASINPLEPARRRLRYEDQLYAHGLRYGGPGLTLAAKMNKGALIHVEAALTAYDPEHMPYNHTKATKLREHLKARLAGA